MENDDLNALINDLESEHWQLDANDIEWLAAFTDPMQAKQLWYQENGGQGSEALTAWERNR